MPRTAAALLILPLLLTSVPAAAGPLEGPQQRAALLQARRERLHQKWEREFREADTDADRRLTQAEAQAAQLPPSLLERFAEIDADHDGTLTPEELLSVYERRVEEQERRPQRP